MIRKKFLFLFVGCVMWVSCSEHAFETSSVVSDSNSVLLTKMSLFNDSFIQSRVETRGWVKPGAWKRAQVIAADCGGAWSLGKAVFWAGSFLSPGGAAGATIGVLLSEVPVGHILLMLLCIGVVHCLLNLLHLKRQLQHMFLY